MELSVLQTIAVLCLTALMLFLLSMRYDPQKPHARRLRSAVAGLMLLTAWNLLPLPHLGVNPLSVMTAGTLGLPGVGLIAVVNLLP